MSRHRRGKTRGGRVGGFPEPERAMRGGSRNPKRVGRKVLDARKILVARLRGKSYRGRSYQSGRDCLRGENYTIIDTLYCVGPAWLDR